MFCKKLTHYLLSTIRMGNYFNRAYIQNEIDSWIVNYSNGNAFFEYLISTQKHLLSLSKIRVYGLTRDCFPIQSCIVLLDYSGGYHAIPLFQPSSIHIKRILKAKHLYQSYELALLAPRLQYKVNVPDLREIKIMCGHDEDDHYCILEHYNNTWFPLGYVPCDDVHHWIDTNIVFSDDDAKRLLYEHTIDGLQAIYNKDFIDVITNTVLHLDNESTHDLLSTSLREYFCTRKGEE